MRLLRYGSAGSEKPGLVDKAGQLRDLSNLVDDIAGDVLLPDEHVRLGDARPTLAGDLVNWNTVGCRS